MSSVRIYNNCYRYCKLYFKFCISCPKLRPGNCVPVCISLKRHIFEHFVSGVGNQPSHVSYPKLCKSLLFYTKVIRTSANRDNLCLANRDNLCLMQQTFNGQMTQVVRRSLLVREVCDSNPEPIKSPTRCQRFTIAVTYKVCALAQSRGDGHRSLVTPEGVLCEYNEDLIFL